MQMAVVRSKINEFHLGAEGMINGASIMQTLLRSLNWTFHINRRQID